MRIRAEVVLADILIACTKLVPPPVTALFEAHILQICRCVADGFTVVKELSGR